MHRLNTEEQLANSLDPDVLVTRSGTSLRLSDSRWVLSNDLAIDWTTVPSISIHFVAALKKYVRQQFINSADTSAFNAFECMLRVMRTIDDMLSGSVDDDDLGYEVFSTAKNRLVAKYSASTIAGDLGAYKRWYIWCADAGLPGFDLAGCGNSPSQNGYNTIQ